MLVSGVSTAKKQLRLISRRIRYDRGVAYTSPGIVSYVLHEISFWGHYLCDTAQIVTEDILYTGLGPFFHIGCHGVIVATAQIQLFLDGRWGLVYFVASAEIITCKAYGIIV